MKKTLLVSLTLLSHCSYCSFDKKNNSDVIVAETREPYQHQKGGVITLSKEEGELFIKNTNNAFKEYDEAIAHQEAIERNEAQLKIYKNIIADIENKTYKITPSQERYKVLLFLQEEAARLRQIEIDLLAKKQSKRKVD